MKRRFFFISLIFSALLACSSPPPRADLIVGIEDYPASLDPRRSVGAYSGKIQQLLFNGLLKFDETGMLVPDLAERYEYVSATQLKIMLRPGIKFHDGHSLTARDVAFTYRSLLDPKSPFPRSEAVQRISQIRVIDDLNLEIELTESFSPFLAALTQGIIPENADQGAPSRPFAERPVGTGPFLWRAAQTGVWIDLDRFEDYFGEKAKIKTLRLETVRDDTMRVLKLIRGELDLVQNSIPIAMTEWLQGQGKLRLISAPGINYYYLGFNLRHPVLKNLKVRQAIALAIDRDMLIRYKMQGFARQAVSLLAPENFYYAPDAKAWPYSVEQAKALLDAAGYPDPDGDGPAKRFTISYKTSNKRDRITLAQSIITQLEAVGIGVELKSYEWSTFYYDIRSGNFDLFSSVWVGRYDPSVFYDIFHSQMLPPSGANRGYYQNTEIDASLMRARRNYDEFDQQQDYRRVQQIVAEELPYVSLWYEGNMAWMQQGWEHYRLSPDASLLGLVSIEKSRE